MNGQAVYALRHGEGAAWRRRIGFAPDGSDLPEHVTVERGLTYLAGRSH
jgi:hypothetical protein